MRETVLARPMVVLLHGFDMRIRQEMPVVLDGITVSLDILACKAEEDADHFGAFEIKHALNEELITQVSRWMGMAHSVYAVVREPGNRTTSHNRRRGWLITNGIGLYYITKAMTAKCQFKARHNPGADPRILEQAFNSAGSTVAASTGGRETQPSISGDPPAGSASGPDALRMTPERSKWLLATRFVNHNPGCTWKQVRRGEPFYKSITAEKAVRAIHKREWLAVRIEPHASPVTFWPQEGA